MNKKLKITLMFSTYLVLGAIIGFMSGYYEEQIQRLDMKNWDGFSIGLFPLDIVYGIFVFVGLCTCLGSIVYIFKFKNERDENRRERLLGNSMMMNTFGIFIMMMAGLSIVSQMFSENLDSNPMIVMLFASLVFLIVNLSIQFQLMSTFNKLFPKRSVDMSRTIGARKAYIDKLDEAEKSIVYKSSYQAFSNTNVALYMLLFITSAYSIFLGFQLFPFIILLTLFIVNNISYFKEAVKHY